MSFLEKFEDKIVLNFMKDNNYPHNLPNKNILKEGWPVYEFWMEKIFMGFWEFIPNHFIGINGTREYQKWCILYGVLLIFNENTEPVLFFEKSGDNFIGCPFNGRDVKYILKYIET